MEGYEISTNILPPMVEGYAIFSLSFIHRPRMGRDENNLAGSTPSDRPPGPSTLPGPGILSGPGNLMCPTGPWKAVDPARLFSSSQCQLYLVLTTANTTMRWHEAETAGGLAVLFPRSRDGTDAVRGGRGQRKKEEEIREQGRTDVQRRGVGMKLAENYT